MLEGHRVSSCRERAAGDAGVRLRSGTHEEGRSLGASSLSPVRELRALEWLPHPDPGLGLCWALAVAARQARVWWKLARRQRQPASREYGLPTMREAKGKKTKGAAWRSVQDVVLRGSGVARFQWAWAGNRANLTVATAQV